MANKLWGGRFSKSMDPVFESFSKSIQYDYKLALYDVLGSALHVDILRKAGLLTALEAKKLTVALEKLQHDIATKKFKPDYSQEDIHTQIQNHLQGQKEIGDLALKLHTARSRNDQVVFATKIYCKVELGALASHIKDIVKAIHGAADRYKDLIIPGFTHMQHAQPVYLHDYLTAYSDMMERDGDRLDRINSGIKITLGAGALAGTPIKSAYYNRKTIDLLRGMSELVGGFKLESVSNSIDAVSDRDYVIEVLSALSIAAMHLSRMSEDLIIWSTKEFGFIEIDEAYSTGSSLMPQKKNADSLELIRGYTGRFYGNLVSVLTMMKGLPFAYNRDMQLDKEPLFNSFEIMLSELKIMEGVFNTIKFNRVKIEEHLEDESLYATDLVYNLVINKLMPFKTAHTIVGKLIKYSLDNGLEIKSMSQEELNKFSPDLDREEILKLFNPKVSVEAKRSIKRKRSPKYA